MKKLLFALSLSVFFSYSVQAQRIAYLYGDSVLKSIPEYGIRVSKLDSVRLAYQKEIENEQNTLQQKLNKLSTSYSPKAGETISELKSRMSPSDTLSMNLLVNNSRQVQEKKQAYDRIVQAFFEKDVQPLLDTVKNITSKYARENKITMVVQYEQLKGALVYIDPKDDITRAIVALLSGQKWKTVN